MKKTEPKTCKHVIPVVCEWQMCKDPSSCPFINQAGECKRPADYPICPIDQEKSHERNQPDRSQKPA